MIGDRVIPSERTTPESLEIHALFADMLSAGCEYAVMEVSSHALTLSRVYGIAFEVGVFTNLTRDHLDFHGSMDEYGDAKALLFRQSKTGVLNLDDEYFPLMTEESTCAVLTFAVTHDDADLIAKRVRLEPDEVTFCALETGRLQKIELHIPGMFSVYNALAALGVCRALGITLDESAQALIGCGGVLGRAEVVPTGTDFTVIIDYAHTPDALSKIISAVREGTKGRVVTLFGCGGDRDKTKRPLMGEIAAAQSDYVVVTSDNPRTEEPESIISDITAGMADTKTPYNVIVNRREAIRWAIKSLQPGDTLILAGKGHETYQIIGKEKSHFDEREEVRAALEI
jgi:UDP-N-acetylmuramoyl-L-alanyl-D-glutamate--2,6-diaminopimelate ligase